MPRLAHALLAVLAALLLAVPTAAQTPEERAQLQWAAARGRLIFGLDRAAWVATDDMLAKVPNAGESGMRGYIVEREGDGFAVTFYGGPPEAPVAFYRARVEDHRVVSSEVLPEEARPALTAMQRRLAAVRDLRAAIRRRPCGSRPFNTVVIPPAAPADPVDLYLLTPQVRTGEFPIGGHFRLTVAADGQVTGERPFTNSCLLMSGAPDQAVAMAVTHLLDPIPTEIHVFTSLTSQLPLYVGTNNPDRTWEITGERIRLVEERNREPARRKR